MTPVIDPEFSHWMCTTFGALNGNWEVHTLWKKVRSTFGSGAVYQYEPGNRGGWIEKDYWLAFLFERDADAIVFKMKMQDTLQPVEKINLKKFRQAYYHFPKRADVMASEIIEDLSDIVDG